MNNKEIFAREKFFGEWVEFYQKLFGLELDPIEIFKKKPVYGDSKKIIVMADKLNLNMAAEVWDHNFVCCRPAGDLDKLVTVNDRDPKNGTYPILVNYEAEPDKTYKNMSAQMLWYKKVSGMTLLERMVFGLKYHLETGHHLDICYWTLCSGSRWKDGSVVITGNCAKVDLEIRSTEADKISSDFMGRKVIPI
jgi:hypothetical protein